MDHALRRCGYIFEHGLADFFAEFAAGPYGAVQTGEHVVEDALHVVAAARGLFDRLELAEHVQRVHNLGLLVVVRKNLGLRDLLLVRLVPIAYVLLG